MKIRFYTLIFVFGWVQDQVHGSCPTQNMGQDEAIQFCSGSNITGNTILLSTEDVSTRFTNCTCYFTVTNSTFVNITGNCTTKIYFGFRHSTVSKMFSGDTTQHMSDTALQFVYTNVDNNTDSYCIRLSPDIGMLEGTCFAGSFTRPPSTISMSTSIFPILSSPSDHNPVDKNETTSAKGITTAASTKENNLMLVIIISLSVVAIASTLVIITVALCLRNRRLKKQENARNRSAASNPSFNQADDSDDEMVYNELYHSRNVNRGHVVSAFSDYEDVTPYGPASVVSNDSGIQSQNGNPSVCAVSVETHNQNEVKKNSEPIYAVPDKKKKKNKEGNTSSYVYAQPERKNKKKRPVTKTRTEKETTQEKETRPEKETQPAAASEDFQFDFTNYEENSMHW